MRDALNPTSDLGFKKILASEDHKTITKGFIADLFGLEASLDDIHIVNPYSIDVYDEQAKAGGEVEQRLRQTLRDVTVSVDTVDVTVELQIRVEASFIKRAWYYHTDLYTSHYDEKNGANRYASLRPVWSLNILGESVFECEHAFHMFTLHDTLLDEPFVPELARIGFFELTKEHDVQESLARWRHFLLTGTVNDTDPDYLKEAASIIRYINLSRQEREMDKILEKAIATDLAIRDYALQQGIKQGIERGIKQGIEQGIEQGIAQGREEGDRAARLANAQAALRMGISHADVAEIAGLDAATIEELAEQLDQSG